MEGTILRCGAMFLFGFEITRRMAFPFVFFQIYRNFEKITTNQIYYYLINVEKSYGQASISMISLFL